MTADLQGTDVQDHDLMSNDCAPWTRACWVCGATFIRFSEVGAWYGFRRRAWCKTCHARKMVAWDVGVEIAQAIEPSLSRWAVSCFSEMAGEFVDSVTEGYECFECPPQSLHLFAAEPGSLAAFNARGHDLEAAGLVEVTPGTGLVRYRLTASAAAALKARLP